MGVTAAMAVPTFALPLHTFKQGSMRRDSYTAAPASDELLAVSPVARQDSMRGHGLLNRVSSREGAGGQV